jgi:penicillin-binding protein 2
VKDVFDTNGELVKTYTPELLSQIQMKNPKTLKFIREGLYQVVNNPKGTAFYRRGQGILMAGKTGTSQVRGASADKVHQKCELMDYESRHHALFVGFAPADNPKIATAVIVEHGCHGSSAAAPVAEAVITKYMQKYHPDMYLENLEKDKTIKDAWHQSLRASANAAAGKKPITAPVAAPAPKPQGDE